MPQRNILVGGQRLIMAIGGALRAALKAGNFTSAARESRRRARALAELNASGGIRGTGQRFPNTREEFFDRGYRYGAIPPVRMRMANLPLENNGLPFAYTTKNNPPSGRVNYVNPETGARATFAPDVGLGRYGSPIQAPYEGFRVLPGQVDEMGETLVRPGPWRGRGEGTLWNEGPINGFDNMDGSYWGSVFPSGFTPNLLLESAPWRMFANPRMTGGTNRAISIGRRIGFDDIMNARGSLIRNRSEIPFSQYDIPF